jgi:uncharacterized ubiquitin-like protein YukD
LHEQNLGIAKESLLQAFESLEEKGEISMIASDYWWVRFGYAIIDLGYGAWLLGIFEEKGYDLMLSPYYTTKKALDIEKQDSKKGTTEAEIYLKNRAVEISDPARLIIEKIKKYTA